MNEINCEEHYNGILATRDAMKAEYLADVFHGCYVVFDKPLPWQEQGLQQTASGYGARLTSRRCVRLPGEKRDRRIYITQHGNAGSAWINYKGRKLHLMDSD